MPKGKAKLRDHVRALYWGARVFYDDYKGEINKLYGKPPGEMLSNGLSPLVLDPFDDVYKSTRSCGDELLKQFIRDIALDNTLKCFPPEGNVVAFMEANWLTLREADHVHNDKVRLDPI